MKRLSHSRSTRPPISVGVAIHRLARRLATADLYYGHGTEKARDDAAALVWHVMKLPLAAPLKVYDKRVPAAALEQMEALAERRIVERIPVVYLTQRCWFAGMQLYVDPRVLIPRSPIAELIEARFQPWIVPAKVRRVLDLGTGSGCIALACARAFPKARVDATDISTDALAVAKLNIRHHRLGRRVRALQSDHFGALKGRSYDIIVSNPPYVGHRELAGLPAEYAHEPRLALDAGKDGLDSVRVILAEAGKHLNPGGILVVEVGNSEHAVRRQFPTLPFTWLAFERGGGGVFLLQNWMGQE
jgi:ribosomal protein L3 glutamine methyltransferase